MRQYFHRFFNMPNFIIQF